MAGSSSDERALPARPHRDSAILYGILAVAIVAIAWLTGGDLSVALLVAIGFFLVSMAWSWWRFRQRLAERATDAKASRRPK